LIFRSARMRVVSTTSQAPNHANIEKLMITTQHTALVDRYAKNAEVPNYTWEEEEEEWSIGGKELWQAEPIVDFSLRAPSWWWQGGRRDRGH
jgi:hypothetical protein